MIRLLALIFSTYAVLTSTLAWSADNSSAFDHSHADLTSLLSQSVTMTKDKSTVDYKSLQKDPFLLNKYLKVISKVKLKEFESFSQNEQLAFLINAYNAFTLKLIVDNYPVKSIKKIGGIFKSPWKISFAILLGQNMSLDDIEHKWLRKKYSEPRLHFAINCASIGCPALRNEAYEGRKLDGQLDEQTRMFLNDSTRNSLDVEKKTLKISPIFKWFKEDFDKAGGVQKFVIPFLVEDPQIKSQMESEKLNVQYTDYNWDLNKSN